jgi:hypothetical protein
MHRFIQGGSLFLAAAVANYIIDRFLGWFEPLLLSTVSGITVSDMITVALVAVGGGIILYGLREERKKKVVTAAQKPEEIKPEPQQEINDEPVLDVVEIINFDQWIPAGHLWENYALQNYCLQIKKVGGKGAAEDCRANIVIRDTSIRNVPAVWRYTNQSTSVDISTIQDLRLFTRARGGHDKIFFPYAYPNKSGITPEGENEQTFSKFVDKELEVWFGSKTGRFLQNPYRKKIADIIKESKSERPD